jgi:hypothetical protein
MNVELVIAGLGWFVLAFGHAVVGLRSVLPNLTGAEHTVRSRARLGFSIAYLVLSLRFSFYVPAFFSAGATACFAVAMVLST